LARYCLTQAIWGNHPLMGPCLFPAGSPIADTAENAVYGDLVYAAICAAPSGASMNPLDAAAEAIMGPGNPLIQPFVPSDPRNFWTAS
jgi:hypothetical protein